jgi:phytol kinase
VLRTGGIAMQIDALVSQYVPSWRTLWSAGPPLLALSLASLWLAARLKQRCHLLTGYSRKIFHLATFTSAGVLQFAGGISLVCVFGAMTTLVLGYAIVRGEGHPFYEALARESDAPYRTHYVVVSYLATLLGGLASTLIAGPYAVCGYVVCGLGDAAGEPIGARWGRHWYAVPARHTTSRRSLEGSAGVFAISALALLGVLAAMTGGERVGDVWPAVLTIALAAALIEAVSPHGWDNAALQIVPSVMAAWMVRP